jgi:hypothetical protein
VANQRHLIICGAEKAGTTSLYTYLAAHPGVVGSIRKETDYFRNTVTSRDEYNTCFPANVAEGALRMESSPGYLAEADTVAGRIALCVPEARLLFVLRDPIDRLRSSFRFYKSRLHVPETMTLVDFVDRCLCFDGTEAHAAALGLKAWHLKALHRSRYELALPAFDACFAPENILVLSFDDLQRDTRSVMARICGFAGVDGSFYSDYQYTSENAGFVARGRGLQAVALFFNNRFERFWRTHPGLKRSLLSVYKRFNADHRAQQDPLSDELRARLKAFFAPTYQFMGQRLAAHPQGTAAAAAAKTAERGQSAAYPNAPH